MGLTICKRLIEQMGGKIKVESTPGEGSCFSFTVSFSIVRDAKIQTRERKRIESHADYAALRILIAEDNEVNQLIVMGLLENLGVTVDMVEDGQQAIAAFEGAQPAYDLVLMDCEMPELDGFDATRRIREIERGRNQPLTPIVALSAHAMIDARDRMDDCGMTGHIAKPVAVTKLADLLDSVVMGKEWVDS